MRKRKYTIPVTVTIQVEVNGEWSRHYPGDRETPEELPEYDIEDFEVDQDDLDGMVEMALEDVDWDNIEREYANAID